MATLRYFLAGVPEQCPVTAKPMPFINLSSAPSECIDGRNKPAENRRQREPIQVKCRVLNPKEF
jgi:hypothetical protein